VPPYDSTRSRVAAWYGAIRACTSSGSAFSDAAVKPTRSQKSTETTFRSFAPIGAGAARGTLQKPQNANPSGFSCPQEGQIAIARVYAVTISGSDRARGGDPQRFPLVHRIHSGSTSLVREYRLVNSLTRS